MTILAIYFNGIFWPEHACSEHRGRHSCGLPQIQLVGLSESRGKAIRERVRAALLNSGFTVPDRRITINLSPADLPTDHPGYDLPIALALLAASNQLPDSIDQTVSQTLCASGELRLDGRVLPVPGLLLTAKSCLERDQPFISGADACQYW